MKTRLILFQDFSLLPPRVSRTAPGLLLSPCLEVIKVEWQCVSRGLEKVMKIVLARDCQCHIKVSL